MEELTIMESVEPIEKFGIQNTEAYFINVACKCVVCSELFLDKLKWWVLCW